MGNCKKCGKKMSMYYGPWCQLCDKPEIETKKTLNLIKALEHLEAIGHDGIKDRIWDKLCDYGYINNDTYFSWGFGDEGEDMETLKSVFELGDSIIFEVSW